MEGGSGGHPQEEKAIQWIVVTYERQALDEQVVRTAEQPYSEQQSFMLEPPKRSEAPCLTDRTINKRVSHPACQRCIPAAQARCLPFLPSTHIEAASVRAQLLHRTGSEGVTGGQHDLHAVLAQPVGDLRGGQGAEHRETDTQAASITML